VFSNEMIDAYIELKMEEVTRFRMTTHPVEYDMYYSLRIHLKRVLVFGSAEHHEYFAKIAFCLLGFAACPLARADVYKCVDDDGHVTYTNTKPSPKAKCTALSRDQRVSTVPGRATAAPSPGPASPRSMATRKGARQRPAQDTRTGTGEQKNLEQAGRNLAEQEAVRTGDERNYQRVLERLQPYKDKVPCTSATSRR
jgi:hypothetical protein